MAAIVDLQIPVAVVRSRQAQTAGASMVDLKTGLAAAEVDREAEAIKTYVANARWVRDEEAEIFRAEAEEAIASAFKTVSERKESTAGAVHKYSKPK